VRASSPTTIVLVSVFLAGAGAAAGGPLTSSTTPTGRDGGLDPYVCADDVLGADVLWEQLPDGVGAIATQDDTQYPFAAECADDFVATGNDLVSVGWWGSYWNGDPRTPDAITVRLYADGGGSPGDLVHEFTTTEFDESRDGTGAGFCLNVPGGGFGPEADTTYFLSIQPSLFFPPQIGWQTGSGGGAEAHHRSDIFGYPDWVPVGEVVDGARDLAFVVFDAPIVDPVFTDCCLPDGSCETLPEGECAEIGEPVVDCDACGATPVQRTTFGQIKALYRE